MSSFEILERSRAGARTAESEVASTASLPELWGGVECTVNRVRDEYFDQFAASGHDSRIGDLEAFARLGIKAIRYPVLWERTLPKDSLDVEQADWTWADERLTKLRELNIRPIVGLVHHGSGPRPTSLVDEAFPEHLARYAGAVARRYPWVEAYTPINEPLTTARFSGLYGHWYPHGRDDRAFARALVTQCRATVLAMRAIREINPRAQLIQTEDLGKTWSTPVLSYQAAFENERRWVTFDLLCGELDRHHPLRQYLRKHGINERKLAWFEENPMPPDVMGLNYYLTSERFLDNRSELYPKCTRGGNQRHSYADTEAVRVRAGGLAGARALLTEAWERFRRPLAVTEVHNGCTREEQMRWFVEVWRDAQSLRAMGVDVRAVTAWSLLGAYDWNSLLTRREGHYEPGVFDLRAPLPRPTALTTVIREIAEDKQPSHPVLAAPGWWHRPSRFNLGFTVSNTGRRQPVPHLQKVMNQIHEKNPRPVLITGATGTLGRAFARLCNVRGIAHHLLTRDEMDIAHESSIAAMLDKTDAWAIINTCRLRAR
jgi:dTDP-4-dehydrorhamnose reductase